MMMMINDDWLIDCLTVWLQKINNFELKFEFERIKNGFQEEFELNWIEVSQSLAAATSWIGINVNLCAELNRCCFQCLERKTANQSVTCSTIGGITMGCEISGAALNAKISEWLKGSGFVTKVAVAVVAVVVVEEDVVEVVVEEEDVVVAVVVVVCSKHCQVEYLLLSVWFMIVYQKPMTDIL